MAIPTALDHKLGEIESLASGVAVALRTLRYSRQRDVRQVRERLQAYVDLVMETANEIVHGNHYDA